jgi:signal transduction histidine kinase
MYKLEGFEEDWNLAGAKQSASYTNLKPGNYTFKVKARIDNADWEEKSTTLQINIVPAWWMALWLKVLLITIFMVSPYFIIQWRTRMLVKQHAKLEAIVNERTREIQLKNEQLHELNAAKVKLFSIISHDLRSPFSAILGFMEMLRDNYKEFSDEDRMEMINQIHATTNQAFYLVENLLNWARVQTSTIQCQPECINLPEIINNNFKLYKSIAESKGIMLEFNITNNTLLFADTHLLETTLRNLLSNAIKFTPAGGHIVVDASRQGETVTISVTDTGTGMNREQIDSLFIFEKTQSQFGTDGEKGSGLGLLLCKEFVEKNQGTITVKSKPGKGSTFSFTVPAFIQQEIQSS